MEQRRRTNSSCLTWPHPHGAAGTGNASSWPKPADCRFEAIPFPWPGHKTGNAPLHLHKKTPREQALSGRKSIRGTTWISGKAGHFNCYDGQTRIPLLLFQGIHSGATIRSIPYVLTPNGRSLWRYGKPKPPHLRVYYYFWYILEQNVLFVNPVFHQKQLIHFIIIST